MEDIEPGGMGFLKRHKVFIKGSVLCLPLKKVDSQKREALFIYQTEKVAKYYDEVIETRLRTGYSANKLEKLFPVSKRTIRDGLLTLHRIIQKFQS